MNETDKSMGDKDMGVNSKALRTLIAAGCLGIASAYAEPIDKADFFNGGFLSAAGNVPPPGSWSIPTGCAKFEIDSPRPKNAECVSVADFGASPDIADNTGAFNRAIAHCLKTGAAKLTVPKGVYRFHSDRFLVFDRFRDFEFDGQGSTFLFRQDEIRRSFITIANCERVRFANFNIDWADWENDPLASIVKTVAVAPSGDYADFEFVRYSDFPRKNLRVVDTHQMDETTMSVGCENAGRAFFTTIPGVNPVPKTEWLSGNVLRVYSDSNRNRFNKFRVGRLFLMRHHYFDMYSVILTKSNAHLTLADVNIYSAPGMGIRAEGDQHHWQLRNVNIVKPPQAQWRPITTTADGLHSKQSLGYFKMEGCEFSFTGDDCVNIHDSAGFGVRSGDKTVFAQSVKSSMVDDLAVGDPLELRYDDYSPTGFTSKIAGIEKLKSPTGANQLKITLEEPLPEQKGKGFVYFNRRYDSGNVIIRNCRVHDNRGRGILIHPENVTVEDNTFFHTERSAVMVLCGYANTWSEGYGASNIVIRNNRFDRIARLKEREMFPVIYISVYRNTDPSREKTDFPILRDILIEGNEFLDSPGAIVYAAAVKNLTIRGNTIEAMTPRNYDFYYRGSIGTESSSDIYVTGNRWRESPLVPEPGIFLDKNTSRDVYCWDNQVLHQESRTGEK